MAEFFEDADLIARTEAVIVEELAKAEEMRRKYAARTKGKTAMLFVGGSRAHHFQDLFKELEMTVLAAGYEFAHRDDYEGRRVISSIKIDADSRNIEELHIEPDPDRFRPRVDSEAEERLAAKGFKFKDYEGMMPEMDSKTLIIDDISARDTETLIEMWKPDVFCAGIKEKFVVQKMGVPCKQLHNYDSGGPYNAFRGAVKLLPGHRPHGQQPGVETHPGSLAEGTRGIGSTGSRGRRRLIRIHPRPSTGDPS
jgi:nitrogenase molybdenum-iron protein alpha chain